MNATSLPYALESCKSFLRAFLVAIALGILAGALMSSVAHAAGLNVSSTQLDGSLPTCRS